VKSISKKIAGLTVLLLSLLACRPVIAIGWPELVIIVVLVAVLMGPLMFRLYRFLDKVRKVSQAEEKKKK
jgi:fatty acid desaturase